MNYVGKKIINISLFVIMDMMLFFLIYSLLDKIFYNSVNFNLFTREGQLPFLIIFISYTLRELYSMKPYLIWEEIRRITSSLIVALIVVVLIFAYAGTIKIACLVATAIIIFFPINIFMRYNLRVNLNKIGLFRRNAIIIGSGFQGQKLEDIISTHPFSGYNIKGYIKYGEEIIKDKKILGSMQNVEKIIKQNKIQEVIISVPKIARNELSDIIYKLEGKVRRIKFIPDMYGLMTFATDIEDYDRVLTITTAQGLLNPLNRFYKRVFDIIGGLVGFMILIPVTIVTYIMIKIEDGGKVFFIQDRLGLNGKKIKIWKLRTMLNNAEKILEDLMEKDPAIKEEYLANKKLKKDPRITKIGNFLRKTSLDEFPQFINVLKGEMSIVGPRPYLFREIRDMGDKYKSIIQTKPGITGLWQASGRNELSFEERIVLDQYYVRNWTLWFDIVIILKTICSVFRAKGAY